MKSGWETTTLSDICLSISGLWTGKRGPFTKIGVLRNTNFTKDCLLDFSNIAYIEVEANSLAKKKLQNGDIIIEKSGGGPRQPVGRAVLFVGAKETFSFSNFTSVLRIKDCVKEKFSPEFLQKYLLFIYTTGVTEPMQRYTTGIRNLDMKEYLKINFSYPPLPEQKRIVGILDAAFEKIDAVQRNAERNLANAKELFQCVLDEEMTPKDGNKLFKLKEIAAILVGYAFKSSGYSTDPHDLKLVCGDNIEPGFFRWDETKYWPRKNVAQYSQFLLKTDDVVLAMDRPWIRSGLKRALVTEDVLPALLLQRTACLRTGDKDIARYLYFILGSSFFVEHVLNQQTPGSVPHISGKQIASFPLYLPEEKRIHSAVQRISTLYEATQTEESKYRRLLSLCAELKRQVLAKAFNGEL